MHFKKGLFTRKGRCTLMPLMKSVLVKMLKGSSQLQNFVADPRNELKTLRSPVEKVTMAGSFASSLSPSILISLPSLTEKENRL
ncbi:protein of unknown function [Mesotoga infera]|uniref:Uncharacterized protein n=1 Tax=Mesotoga infera TaxID=1236046 RepID=A0A7Z7LEM3_9BACT|nr:protein of unknown function [Mesotoga infera]